MFSYYSSFTDLPAVLRAHAVFGRRSRPAWTSVSLWSGRRWALPGRLQANALPPGLSRVSPAGTGRGRLRLAASRAGGETGTAAAGVELISPATRSFALSQIEEFLTQSNVGSANQPPSTPLLEEVPSAASAGASQGTGGCTVTVGAVKSSLFPLELAWKPLVLKIHSLFSPGSICLAEVRHQQLLVCNCSLRFPSTCLARGFTCSCCGGTAAAPAGYRQRRRACALVTRVPPAPNQHCTPGERHPLLSKALAPA